MKKYKNLIELRFKIKREYSGVRKVSTKPPPPLPFIYWMVNKFESNSKFKKIKYWKFMKSMKNLSALNYHKRWNLLPFVGKLGTKKLFTKQSKQPTERKNMRVTECSVIVMLQLVRVPAKGQNVLQSVFYA